MRERGGERGGVSEREGGRGGEGGGEREGARGERGGERGGGERETLPPSPPRDALEPTGLVPSLREGGRENGHRSSLVARTGTVLSLQSFVANSVAACFKSTVMLSQQTVHPKSIVIVSQLKTGQCHLKSTDNR